MTTPTGPIKHTDPFFSLGQSLSNLEYKDTKKELGASGVRAGISRIWTDITGNIDEKLEVHHQDLKRKAVEQNITDIVKKIRNIEENIQTEMRAVAVLEATIPALKEMDLDASDNIKALITNIHTLETIKSSWTRMKGEWEKIHSALKGTLLENNSGVLKLREQMSDLDALISTIPTRDVKYWEEQVKSS